MANLTSSRLLTLAVLTAVSACGLVLDLPNPTLDPSIGGGGPDGSTGADVVVPGSEAGNPDAQADAPASCDLTLPQNCGACGVDCTNGTCNAGICRLTNSIGGDTLRAPEGITIMGDKAYVAIAGEPAAIGVCDLNGCKTGMSSLLSYDAAAYQEPYAITNDNTSLFWASYGGDPTSGVYRTELDGSTVQLNAAAPERDYATGVAIGGTHVLWVNANDPGGGFVCDKTIGCGTTLTPIDNGVASHTRYGRDVLVTPMGSVWGINGEIVHCPSVDCVAGGARTLCNGYDALAFDGRNSVYFRTFEGDIARTALDVDATARETVVTADKLNGQGPHVMLVVGNTLYWAIAGTVPDGGDVTTDGKIQKCTLPSCTDITTIAENQAAPVSLATDGKAIYWVNSGKLAHYGSPGSVQKAPL